MKKYICLFLAVVCVIFSAGCGEGDPSAADKSSPAEENTRELFAMDTYMTLTAYGEKSTEALDAAEKEIKRLDSLLSVGDENSEIARMNENGGGTVSEDTAALLGYSRRIYEETDGAFDITIYPLMKLWGFTEDKQSVPDEKKISSVLADTGFDRLNYNNGKLTLGSGQGIDFGGIAKGYTSGRVMKIFSEYGISSGIVSLGGNVQCCGKKQDGSLWRCGITDPDHPEDSSSLAGIVSVSDKAVITSGGYERFFTENGKTYHHIMDPSTGHPSESDLVSVSIVSDDATLADGLSTACFVMGREKAVQYWRSHSDEFDMILIDTDRKLYITAGLDGSFESDLSFQVIDRRE